ncbi:carbon storage regulator CsrA [Mesobacillus harenae]|uniref:carbon storage regulator CsrA n=1 Tax=Mesobacillus harenae TaxID=2213203 RepID=UPI001580E837|nr:carbon storage regulator CsrA [Mesobacillus harenae]
MLVLTRRNGETIKIGDDIEITVISSKNDQVKIGIKAPKNIEVFRKELFDQIQTENEQASKDVSSLIDLLRKKDK